MTDLFLAGQRVAPARAQAAGYAYVRPTLQVAFDRLQAPDLALSESHPLPAPAGRGPATAGGA